MFGLEGTNKLAQVVGQRKGRRLTGGWEQSRDPLGGKPSKMPINSSVMGVVS